MEHRDVPKHIEELVVNIGGMNPFGKPMFRVVWGGTAIDMIYGQMAGGTKGQHQKLRYNGVPAWFIEIWKPADMFGTPEEWYEKSYDLETGLHVCGDYPFQGDYCPCLKLYKKEERNGQPYLDILPLTSAVIETFVPLIQRAKLLTIEERKRINAAKDEKEKQDRLKQGHDAYVNASPAFGGVAGTYESNREAWTKKYEFPISAQQIKAEMGTGHRQLKLRDRE